MRTSNLTKLIVSLTILFVSVFSANATRRYAVATGSWDAITTWSATSAGAAGASVPVAGDSVYIGEGLLGYTVTIPASTAVEIGHLFIGSGSAVTTSSLALSASTSSLLVTGNITINKPSGNAVNSLAVNAGNAIVNGNITLAGTTTQNARVARVTITSGTLDINGNLVFTTGSAQNNSLDMSGGAGTLILRGLWTATVGGLNSSTTSTVKLLGTAAQTLPAGIGNYNNIELNNAAGVTLGGALTATTLRGNIVIGNSTATPFSTNNANITFAAGKSLTLAEGSTITAGTSVITMGTTGNVTINGTFKTANVAGFSGAAASAISSTNAPVITLGANNTVEFNNNSATAQTVTGRADYGNLILSGNAPKTLAAAATVNKDLTSSGGNVADGGRTLTVKGNIDISNNITGTGKITLSGGTAAHTINGLGTIAGLEINDANGASLSSNMRVSGTLTFTSGKIASNGNILTVGISGTSAGTISGASATSYLVGTMRRFIPNGAGTTANFTIGDENNYTPLNITFIGTSLSGSGYLEVSTAVAQPAPESGIDQIKYVNRKWTVTNSGVAGFTSFSGTFNYVSGDLAGSPNTSLIMVRRFSGGIWHFLTSTNQTSQSVTATGITGFGDFYLGESEGSPVISLQPLPASICKGENASFTSNATASFTPQVKWQRSTNGTTWTDITASLDAGTTYSGFTTETLSLTGSTTALNGYKYRAVFSNINGSTNSSEVSLTVQDNPVSVTIASSDADNNICQGNSVTFTATPVNGGTSPAYQWKINGADVSGETAATFTTGTLANGDAVSVVLTSNITPCASGNPASSNTITTTVVSAPTVSVASNNSPICEGQNAIFNLTGTSGATVTYNINGGASATKVLTGGAASITVNAVTSNTILNISGVSIAACTETTSASSTVIVNNKTFSTETVSECNSYTWNGRTFTTSGTYKDTLSNAANCDSILTLNLTINKTGITTQPVGGSICAGSSITLSVVGSGPGTLTYQWVRNGEDISGATNANYSAADTGTYFVKVTGDCGTLNSSNVSVTFKTPTSITTQPTGGLLCSGSTLSIVANGTGAITYQWLKNDAPIAGATSASYVVTSAGAYKAIAIAQCGNDTSSAATVTLKPATVISTEPAGGSICADSSILLSVTATGDGTLSYQWRRNGTNISGATASSYNANLTGTYSVIVIGGCGSDTSANATVSSKLPTTITTQPQSSSICAGSSVTLSVTASGSGTLTYQWFKDGTNIPGATQSTYNATQSGTYAVVVNGECGFALSTNAVITNATATTITTEPQSASICAGGNGLISVTAVGQGTLTYQWRRNGTNISGATASSYNVTQTGTYSVIVTALCGSDTSANATITVSAATAITTQPVGGAICPGATLVISVIATGEGTPTYQWRRDGVNITGATAASYTASLAGTYTVVVTAACGSVTSSNAVVTLKTVTAITTQPASATICSTGGTAVLSVVAAGNTLTYQWRKDGVNITGATAASYTANATGVYSVVVTGECGTVTSSNATVSLKVPTSITTQPANGGLCSGGTYTLSVVAGGDGPFTYQWRRNGANITGATSSSYTATQTGTYTVLVTGACGSITSAGASVVLLSPGNYSFFPESYSVEPSKTGTSIEAGNKFFSRVNGYITAIRFLKASNFGEYTVSLWDGTTKARLATAPVVSTVMGWVTVPLPNPVAITANKIYVASYYSVSGWYMGRWNYFDTSIVKEYITIPAGPSVGGNGVLSYGASVFPEIFSSGDRTYVNQNLFADVVFTPCLAPDVTGPVVISKLPVANTEIAPIDSKVTATFNEAVDPAYINAQSIALVNTTTNVTVSASVAFDAINRKFTLTPTTPLAYNTTYRVTLKGGTTTTAIRDVLGNRMASDYSWVFKTPAVAPLAPDQGNGGPILILSSSANKFSSYYAEILRAEGINSFRVRDINTATADTLNRYDVVLLGDYTITSTQATLLTNWVNAGGTLITFKPDSKLHSLLGIAPVTGTLSDKYLLVNTSTDQGKGIVGETMQFHGSANLYTATTANSLATLYSTSTIATTYPAVTAQLVGANGGKAVAFAFDLARSIVYTRQGNPAWAGQKRDGQGTTTRSDDMFFGNTPEDPQPDWIDFDKIQIPQADEQQHFLANIIMQGIMNRRPLPKFWILPLKYKAAVIMSGDDHANSGTAARFREQYNLGNNSPEDLKNWRSVRSTSYIYPSTLVSFDSARIFTEQGFELSLHLNTLCQPYNGTTLSLQFGEQLNTFSNTFPNIPAPATHRTHCIVWSDWATKPKMEILYGIRLNTDYYYWPASWVKDRPGMFTGSGLPMRFADLDGTMIDNYQVTTQMTDESGITLPGFVNTLLDNALGEKGYYGVFCANFHTDIHSDTDPITLGSRAIVNAARSRNVPVISSKQMLTWLDGRNNSTFSNMTWNNGQLNFSVFAAPGADNLQGMLPTELIGGRLQNITVNGSPLTFTVETIKGMEYAFFNATTGNYIAYYLIDNNAPLITNIKAVPNLDGSATITWKTNEEADSKVLYGISPETLTLTGTGTFASSKYVTDHSVNLPGLTAGATYYYRVVSADINSNSSTSPSLVSAPLTFTMPGTPCFFDNTTENFNQGTTGDSTYITSVLNGEVKLKPGAAADFAVLPPEKEWKSFSWTGGTSTINNGSIVVNGARFNTQPATATFGPGTSLEFIATFTGPFQAIGFGAGTDATGAGGIFNGESGWLIFSTDATGTALKTSSWSGTGVSQDFTLSGSFIGTSKKYRIEWKTNAVEYYINDILVRNEPIAVAVPMRPAISDYSAAAPAITVDWINTYPYKSTGNFTSRVYDAGVIKTWKNALWTAQVPDGTSIQISYRRGNTPSPDSTWSSFAAIAESNTILDVSSRYLQYRVTLSTTNGSITPVLNSIGVSCTNVAELLPVVTKSPQAVTACANQSVLLTSTAIGVPVPKVQWQYSTDNGNSWLNLTEGTKDSVTILVSLADHNKKFRAIWSNTSGSDTSDAANLTVGTISGSTLAVAGLCNATSISLALNVTTGTGPYSLVINDSTYTNIQSGVPFNTGLPVKVPTESIWGSKSTGDLPAEADPSAVELGFKFKANIAGRIMGVRFYKNAANTGTHTGSLWTADGTLLAKATFTNETASGWQEVRFASPVTITPGVTYVASYFAPNGNYSYTGGVFLDNVENAFQSLTGLRASDVGGNGLYRYGGGFPNGVSGGSGSYYVDVLFENSLNISKFILTRATSGIGCVTTGAPLSTLNVNLTPPSLSFTRSTLACEESKDGTLSLTATNGNTPYSFSVDNGTTFQSSGNFTGLGSATYQVKLKDAGNCVKDTSVVISPEKAIWTGAVSTDWHTAGNWNTLKVPTATTNVIIPVGTNECIISTADAAVSSIQIRTGAGFRAVNNRKLTVAGKCTTLPAQ